MNSVTINGTTYSTVVIGNQTWTTENYTSADTVSFNGTKFYTYAQAMSMSLPTGWRIPTQTDFNNLMKIAGGTLDPNSNTIVQRSCIQINGNKRLDSKFR